MFRNTAGNLLQFASTVFNLIQYYVTFFNLLDPTSYRVEGWGALGALPGPGASSPLESVASRVEKVEEY